MSITDGRPNGLRVTVNADGAVSVRLPGDRPMILLEHPQAATLLNMLPGGEDWIRDLDAVVSGQPVTLTVSILRGVALAGTVIARVGAHKAADWTLTDEQVTRLHAALTKVLQ